MDKSPPQFEAMTTGALVDRIFKLYGANFALMLGIVAASHIPIYALQAIFNFAIRAHGKNPPLGLMLGNLFVTLAWILIAYPVATGAATFAISERYLGHQIRIGTAFGHAWRRLRTIINAQMSVGLRVMFGFILLIVPGILWALSYSVTIAAVVVEGANARESMRRSRELTSGNRRKVFNVLALIGAIGLVATFAATFLSHLVFGSEGTVAALLGDLSTDLASMLVTPVSLIGSILLYYDLRIRKEGFDLEMLSHAMGSQSASAVPPFQAS